MRKTPPLAPARIFRSVRFPGERYLCLQIDRFFTAGIGTYRDFMTSVVQPDGSHRVEYGYTSFGRPM